ncbi:copper amine oxidase N-terminal domain-containing protein [Saccharibacillus brassicae]|uniref:Copper amine oxidase N-terminal domain-containing protein n=1 Tax=Saccharibacillus brassicae TaxID=2583377 RepID=A0A4Y6UPM7_SACBS|nr:copper amine oxidase N-terminal domain-containing protein [Saccharibacillus brassicae]QDH19583.1 copper amine oxidase N-terminal domain-containing protein [Saccharibacillus brassicae]
MNGNFMIKTALAAGIMLGAAFPAPQLWGTSAYAQSTEPTMSSGLDARNYVLDDGSLRAEGRTIGKVQEPSPFVGLTRDSQTDERYAWTADGKVYQWRNFGVTEGPERLSGLPPIAQVSEDVMLAKSGEVVGYAGAGLPKAVKISAHSAGFALLTGSGEIWRYRPDYAANKLKKLADLPGTTDIQSSSGYVMALGSDGTVTKIDAETGDEPETLTTGAVSIAWVKHETSSDLYVAKSDGSLWQYEYGSAGFEEAIPSVKGAVSVSKAEGGLFVRLSGGKSGLYAEGKWTPLAPARLQSAVLTLSRPSAAKGDPVRVTVEEKFSDGTKLKRLPAAGELNVSDPKIAALQKDGSLKANGLGAASVTFTSNGISAKTTLIVKSDTPLTGAGLIGGSSYLPVRSVFTALGATVSNAGGSWNIQYGDTKIQLNTGSSTASVNGKAVALKGKVQTLDGQAVFPASFLPTIVPGAAVQWDAKLQQAILAFGPASLQVESKQTALLRKKQQLGSLAQQLGKSYWINTYSGAGVRFSKLTVADIKTKEGSSGRLYTIVFKNAAGSQFASSSMYASGVLELLGDPNEFFPFDPKARYGGSSKVWNQIRGHYVSSGMNKQHVLLSWGEPTEVATQSSPKGPIEVWVYMRGGLTWQAVAFVKGTVLGVL